MQTVEKFSITLPTEMVRVIREKVGTGTYSSNSEVIREALPMLIPNGRKKSKRYAKNCGGVLNHEGCYHRRGQSWPHNPKRAITFVDGPLPRTRVSPSG